jgi:hypothetical protein
VITAAADDDYLNAVIVVAAAAALSWMLTTGILTAPFSFSGWLTLEAEAPDTD